MLTNKVRTYAVHREIRTADSHTPKNLRKQDKKSSVQTPEQAIYILNRGRNAGKPLRQPCPNCFIYYCSSPEEIETVYWTFYALWKNGFFHPHLCGSVIEMLRLSDLKILLRNWIQPGIEKANRNPEMVNKIKSTWELEQKMQKQSELLKQLRDSLVRKYYFSI